MYNFFFIKASSNWQPGLCLGGHFQAKPSYTADECLFDCKNHVNCKFVSFDSKNKICHFNTGCSQVVNFDSKYTFTKKNSDYKGKHKIREFCTIS